MFDDKLFDKIYEMKMVGNQFRKEAAKSQAMQQKLQNKIKLQLQKNDVEGAKISAQQAIACKKEYTRYTALSSKISSIASKMQAVSKQMALSNTMKNLVASMPEFSSIANSVNAMESLENFEKMVDNIDVHAGMMDQVFDNINDPMSNEAEVNDLINQIQMANANKMEDNMVDADGNKINVPGVKNANQNPFNMNNQYHA